MISGLLALRAKGILLMPESTHTAGRTLPRLLSAYVLAQPVLDVLTSLAVQAGISLTAGTIVRTLFLGAVFFYIFLCGPFPGRKPVLVYLGLLTGYLAAFCIWSFSLGGLSLCIQNTGEALKVFYFPYTAAFFYTVYRQRRYVVPDWVPAASGAGYCLVILIAWLTGTSFVTYNAGYGYSGWFFAANDVSTVILLTAPVLLCLCLIRLSGRLSWKAGCGMAVILVSLIFSANFIGTKLVFLGVLAYLAAALVWFLIRFALHRRRTALRCAAACALLCAALAGLYPVSPLNQYVQDIYVPMSGEDQAAYEASLAIPGVVERDRLKANREMEEAAEGTWLGELIQSNALVKKANWLLSRRLLILAPIAQEYADGNAGVKLLGLGYAQAPGYTREIIHLIEMEGPALLLRHGMLGFLLYYVPYLGAVAWLIFQFFRRLKTRMGDFTYCSLLYGAMLAFAASMVTGHTLATPCVSLVAALIYEKLFLRTLAQNRALKHKAPLPAEGQPF